MKTKTLEVTKHTPGPWKVQPDPEWAGKHPYHDHRFISAGPDLLNSDEWGGNKQNCLIASLRDCENQEANARLIAAAPELLEALKAVRDGFERNLTEPMRAYQEVLRRFVKAAIDKAEVASSCGRIIIEVSAGCVAGVYYDQSVRDGCACVVDLDNGKVGGKTIAGTFPIQQLSAASDIVLEALKKEAE